MDWFFLTLISAFSLATADALTKKYYPDYSGWEIVLVRFVPALVIFLPLALLNFPTELPLNFWAWILILVPMEVTAMYLYMVAIRESPLALTLPYLAFTPAFNILTAYVVLGEVVSWQGAGGIFLIVAGAYLLNFDHITRRGRFDMLAPFTAIIRQKGSRYMLIASAIYSLTGVMSKAAMLYTRPEWFGYFYMVAVGFGTILWVVIRDRNAFQVLTKGVRRYVTISIFMMVMFVTHFLAIAQIEAAYMVSVKRTSLLFGIVYGALLFKERNFKLNFVAGLIMILGVVVILQ